MTQALHHGARLGALRMLAAFLGIRALVLVKTGIHLAIVQLVDPGPVNFVMEPIAPGLDRGGTWAIAFIAIGLIDVVLQMAILIAALRGGPPVLWAAFGFLGVLAWPITLLSSAALPWSLGSRGAEALAALSVAMRIEGLAVSIFEWPWTIALLVGAMVAARPFREPPESQA